MGRSIGVVDETLRDAQQCLWSAEMTNEMMLPFAERMDAIGFDAIDLIGGTVFDVCVRFLKEDPWARIRHVRALVGRTSLNAWIRGRSLWTSEVFADDVVELAIERLAANGIRRVSVYDRLNDLQNLRVCFAKAKSQGLEVCGALVFTLSPVHTDEYYAEKAAELAATGVDEIVLADPSGLLSVGRVGTLVPALKRAAGTKVPLNLHSHCVSGRAPQVMLESVALGVDKVHTAISPLAHGVSHPPTEYASRHLRRIGYEVRLDDGLLAEMADYFRFVARRWDKPLGEPVEYDPLLPEHQMPGGMITNLRTRLREAGIEHRLDEVLLEAALVREELGYPPMVSPNAQLVVTQAVLNVVHGERYRSVPDEVRKYVLGYYGRPPAPVAPNLVDRVATGRDQAVSGRPGLHVPEALERLRRERGPFRCDEDLLLAAFYSDEVLRPLFAARERVDYTRFYRAYGPARYLLSELARRPEVRFASVRRDGRVALRLSQ